MRIEVTTDLATSDIEAMTDALARFERMRSLPALGILGALAAVALLALPGLPAAVAVIAFLVMAALAFNWHRTAQRAARAAQGLAGRARVVLTDQGLSATGATGGAAELAWDQVVHATKTQAGWIIVGRGGRTAATLPAAALTDAQAGRLQTFFAGWSMRRYRRAPW